MMIQVLGSGAGGGLPQWNCNCRNCQAARRGQIPIHLQSSIALSDHGEHWLLCNASPDILQQIRNFAPLHPQQLRGTGIAAILVVDGQIDHTTGLYMLREHTEPWQLWCTQAVEEDLRQGHAVLPIMDHFCGVHVHTIPLDGRPFQIPALPDLQLTAMALQSKAAPYSPHRHASVAGDNIGLMVRDLRNSTTLFYAPGLGVMESTVWSAMQQSDCVMVDGTFWSDDEMAHLGITGKSGRELGHLPQSGADGMLSWLKKLPQSTRKILIHINNTNPILDSSSDAYRQCQVDHVEVAFDGMSIQL